MDRPIERKVTRTRMLRRIGIPLALAAIVFWAGLMLTGWIRPSVQRNDIRTARVERGAIEATVSASGTVLPEYEHVITSPIDSRITRIVKKPGDQVDAGETIVELDLNESESGLEKLSDKIALKRIEREEAKQNLAKEVSDLRGKSEIKALERRSLEYEANRCRENLETLFSRDDLRKAENDADRARIELEQIERSIVFAEQALETELDRIDLELDILQKEWEEAAHRLRLATAASDRTGVLTWVAPSEGLSVRRGDELARVADLTAFRVEATVSDVHGSRIAPGLPTTLRAGETELRGVVMNVLPTVENGAIKMDVALDEKRHPVLRHNLRVDVYIVTDRVEDALYIKRGSFLNLDGDRAVFVVRGDKAVRTLVEFGLTNFDYYQVLQGLSEGDQVILSDMSHHTHVKEVRLR